MLVVRISDGNVFRNTSFYKKLQQNKIEIPVEKSHFLEEL